MRHAVRCALALGWSTWLEAMRNRLLLVSVMFGVVLVGLSVTAASVAIYEQARLIIDVGLAAMSCLGSIIAVALSVTGFAAELSSRTAYPVLVRPMPRWSFVLGKYLGTVAAMLLVTGVMALCTAGVVWVYDGAIPTAFWHAVWLSEIEMCVAVAVALLFSTLAVPILAATYSAGVLLAGNLAGDILHLASRQAGTSAELVLRGIYYVMPNLDLLSARGQAANNLTVPAGYVAYGTLYGLTYAATALLLATAAFSRRRAI